MRHVEPTQPEEIETMDPAAILPYFLECCAWAESGDPQASLGETAPDFSPEAEAYALARCASFLHNNPDVDGLSPESVGHDLWLTSQGQGAGFWDRGYEYARGQRLTARAKLEQMDVYVGEDGLAHFNGEA
jgi:hypothetical protein